MGLRWNADNIKNWDPENVHTPALTRDIVHICHDIGINQITDKNYKEWYQRWIAGRIATGGMLKNPADFPVNPNEYVLTIDQVRAYIGLTTNASRQTDFVFKKNLAMALLDTADHHIRIQEGRINVR